MTFIVETRPQTHCVENKLADSLQYFATNFLFHLSYFIHTLGRSGPKGPLSQMKEIFTNYGNYVKLLNLKELVL